MKKTAIFVALFIIVLIAAGYSAKSNADNGFRVGIGKTVVNSSAKIGEVGYEYNNFELQASLMEADDTKRGPQDKVAFYSFSHLTKPDWGYKGIDPYFRLGVSYNDNSVLVGDTNFKLGVGVDFHDVWRAEYTHHSSAGIHNPNTGIDYVSIVFKMPTDWR